MKCWLTTSSLGCHQAMNTCNGVLIRTYKSDTVQRGSLAILVAGDVKIRAILEETGR